MTEPGILLTGGGDLLHMRTQWRNEAAFAVALAPPAPGFGRRRRRWRDIDLVVDLAEEPLSRRWWRGVATLSACSRWSR